jgi:hypothetical protein
MSDLSLARQWAHGVALRWPFSATNLRHRHTFDSRDPADAGAASTLARTHDLWWYGLGVLWLLDGLLQLQPAMFTPAVAVNVIQPAMEGQPDWIGVPMLWCMQLWQHHPVLTNVGVAGLELLIAALLLGGRHRRAWGRLGLFLSIGWGLIAWYVGEGLGGLVTGSATMLTGAPGSALLYALLATALLLPEEWWTSARALRQLRVGTGLLWLVGASLQLAPLYWSPFGLASVLQDTAMMPQPLGVQALDFRLVATMAAAPALWNGLLCAAMAGLGVSLLLDRGGRTLYALAGLWLLALWVVFQGFGMIFSGMATDPNTPPLLALLLVPGWLAARAASPVAPTAPAATRTPDVEAAPRP